MKLTELEIKMLNKIPESCYCNYDPKNPSIEDMRTWTFDVVRSNEDKGVVSSLIKKGLVEIMDWDADTAIEFTSTGFQIWRNL